MLSKPERRKASGWRCYDDLRPQLEGVPAEVLDGLAELIEQPDIPGGGERANALIGQHNEWIRAEARRLGLLR